jgi:hypothetical protein
MACVDRPRAETHYTNSIPRRRVERGTGPASARQAGLSRECAVREGVRGTDPGRMGPTARPLSAAGRLPSRCAYPGSENVVGAPPRHIHPERMHSSRPPRLRAGFGHFTGEVASPRQTVSLATFRCPPSSARRAVTAVFDSTASWGPDVCGSTTRPAAAHPDPAPSTRSPHVEWSKHPTTPPSAAKRSARAPSRAPIRRRRRSRAARVSKRIASARPLRGLSDKKNP